MFDDNIDEKDDDVDVDSFAIWLLFSLSHSQGEDAQKKKEKRIKKKWKREHQ